jgi:hypothetical protein
VTNAWLRAIGFVLALACGAGAADDPLADLVLDDASGRARALDELRDRPVLLVIADRRASQQASEWGARLAAQGLALAPWSAPGRVVWLSIADLRGVPEYARDEARERLEEREAGRGATERSQCSPLLADWEGRLAESFRGTRGEALIVLLSRDHQPVHRERGAPTDEAVGRLSAAVEAVTPR